MLFKVINCKGNTCRLIMQSELSHKEMISADRISARNQCQKGSGISQSFIWGVVGEGSFQVSCLSTIAAPSVPSSSASLPFPFTQGLKRIRQESH